jgi:hypothetical protein
MSDRPVWRNPNYTPNVGDRVSVDGKDGIFVVVAVNLDKRKADVQPETGDAQIKGLARCIPFDHIRPATLV